MRAKDFLNITGGVIRRNLREIIGSIVIMIFVMTMMLSFVGILSSADASKRSELDIRTNDVIEINVDDKMRNDTVKLIRSLDRVDYAVESVNNIESNIPGESYKVSVMIKYGDSLDGLLINEVLVPDKYLELTEKQIGDTIEVSHMYGNIELLIRGTHDYDNRLIVSEDTVSAINQIIENSGDNNTEYLIKPSSEYRLRIDLSGLSIDEKLDCEKNISNELRIIRNKYVNESEDEVSMMVNLPILNNYNDFWEKGTLYRVVIIIITAFLFVAQVLTYFYMLAGIVRNDKYTFGIMRMIGISKRELFLVISFIIMIILILSYSITAALVWALSGIISNLSQSIFGALLKEFAFPSEMFICIFLASIIVNMIIITVDVMKLRLSAVCRMIREETNA